MTLDGNIWHASEMSAERGIDTHRTEWLKADLRCLMCGRVVGQLVSPRAVKAAASGAEFASHCTTFRPADSSAPVIRLSGREQFHCATCGGSVILDQQEPFSIYAEVYEDGDGDEPRGRGRPPKPWRRATSRQPDEAVGG